jgi:hypothetical protein
MATMEMPLVDELEKVFPAADFSVRWFEPKPNNIAPLEPWKQAGDAGTAAETDWLFETLMA